MVLRLNVIAAGDGERNTRKALGVGSTWKLLLSEEAVIQRDLRKAPTQWEQEF